MRAASAVPTWLLLLLLAAAGCSGKKKPAQANVDAAVAPIAREVARDAAAATPPGKTATLAPTRAECETAVSNMQKISPGLVPGDAVDLEECMKLPRTLVVCLQTAASSVDADRCVDRAATEVFGTADPGAHDVNDPGGAPEPRASTETCRKMVAHYRSLLPADERDETPEAGMLAACTRELTPSEADCVNAARSLPEAETCLEGS